jgi:hypothetical protein
VRARRWLVLALLLAAYFATRLTQLTLLPIFMDESMHVAWAVKFAREPGFLRPLDDGKLLHILASSLVVPHAAEPLWGGRATAVVAGALALLSARGLGRRLFDPVTGLLAAALYVVCPFTLLYDRLDLADVYLSAATGLTLLAATDLLARPSLRRGAALGLAMSACVLAKMPGLVTLAFPVGGWALLAPRRTGARRALALSYGLCVLVVIGPLAYFLAHTTQFQAKLGRVPAGRLGLLLENLRLAAEWLWAYWTPPLFVVGAAAGILGAARRRGPELFLLFTAALPAALFAATARAWFPRYILFASVPFLVLAARGLVLAWRWARDRWPGQARLRAAAGVLLGAALLSPALRFDHALLTDPTQAPWPEVDGFQYVWGWPSGYGWERAVAFLRDERSRHPEGITVVGDTLGHGAGHWAVRAHFANDPGVEVAVLDLEGSEAAQLIDERSGSRPVYALVAKRPRLRGTPLSKPHFVARYRKPHGVVAGMLFRMAPRPAPMPSPGPLPARPQGQPGAPSNAR